VRQLKLKGQGVSPGIAIGRAFVLEHTEDAPVRVALGEGEVEEEVKRLLGALEKSEQQLAALKERIRREVGDDHAYIFDAQLMILRDDMFVRDTIGRIRTENVNVEWALKEAREHFERLFRDMDDAYIADRGTDIGDAIHRVQRNLGQQHIESMEALTEEVVLAARDLTPSQAVQMEKNKILGFAIDTSSRTSHAIILARSLKIPAVIGLHDFSFKVRNNEMVIVDGTEGDVLLNPPEAVIREYLKKKEKYEDYQQELTRCARLPAITQDGVGVLVQANIEQPSDVGFLSVCGAEGVGLFRTEYLMLADGKCDPDEEMQFEAYAAVARGVAPYPAVIRTADLGGDKVGDEDSYGREDNPKLGLRAVRLCLHRHAFFKRQIRALLRASLHGDLRILIPMISGVGEVRQVKRVIDECRAELVQEGRPVAARVPLGIMIEVPSAVTVADLLAKEVDFFSIGTNDLIQHTLAVDRDNDSVTYLYEPLHPAILRSLDRVIRDAAGAGIRVSLCGEAASEPLFALIMLGLGLREFSMNPAFIPVIKRVVRLVRAAELEMVAREALQRPTAQEIEEYVLERLVAKFPDAVMSVPGGYNGER